MTRCFSFDARITRLRLLGAHLIALALAWIAILFLRTGEPLIVVTTGTVGGAVLAKLLVEAVRRRHDMGASGTAAVMLFAGGMTSLIAALTYALGTGAFAVLYATLVLLAAGWAVLLLRAGEIGTNRYGPAPANALLPAFGERRGQGAVAAILLTVLGATTGFAATRWTEGMRRHQAQVLEQTDAIEAAGTNAGPDELERSYAKGNAR